MAGVLDNIFGFVEPALTGITNIANDIVGSIITLAPEIIQGIADLIGPIAQAVWNVFEPAVDGLSWLVNSTYEVVRGIPDLIISLIDLLSNIANYINPLSDSFFLKIAFIPSDGFFTYYVSEHFLNIMNSFWVVQLYTSVTDQLKAIAIESPKPIFEITLPAKYGGQTLSVIDFSFYDEYRDYIHLFIKVITWFFFLKSIVRRAPDIIYK